jgi:predicted ATPase
MVAPFHEPMVSPVIVGRAAHLAFFDRILDDSRSGRGHTLLVSGEPGIGKSRLVSEGKRRAQHLGFATLEGWCFETDRSLPYAPVADLLRGHIFECPPEGLAGRLGPGAAEFVQVLPELAGRLPGLRAPERFEPGQERRRLFQAVAQLIADLARRGPVLMLVEDLHWSDELSLELLLALARRISLQPVLLLLTYRSDEVSPGLSQLLAELDRRRLASELALSPLEPAEVEEMVRAILGLDHPPRSEFLADLYALTEGNPFFVEEVLRSLVHTGEIFHLRSGWDRRPNTALPIPRSVQESVRRRSAGLTTRAGEALVLAAVAGRRFDVRLLRELLEADEQELVVVIKELLGAQLVVETSADRFAFRHALTREAIETGLPVITSSPDWSTGANSGRRPPIPTSSSPR